MEVTTDTLELEIDEIQTSSYFQIRSKGTVSEHVDALVVAESWEPIVVGEFSTEDDGDMIFLIDGHHRLEAAKKLGYETIEVKVFDGTVEQAREYAYQTNLKNGLPLSFAEKKRYALQLLQSDASLSNREIGRRSGLSHQTIASLRQGDMNPDRTKQTPLPSRNTSLGTTLAKNILKMNNEEYGPDKLVKDMEKVFLRSHTSLDKERNVLIAIRDGLNIILS